MAENEKSVRKAAVTRMVFVNGLIVRTPA